MGPCNEVVFLGGVERWERSETTGQGLARPDVAPAPGAQQAGAARGPAAVGAHVRAGDSQLVDSVTCLPACGMANTALMYLSLEATEVGTVIPTVQMGEPRPWEQNLLCSSSLRARPSCLKLLCVLWGEG